jgi:TRAP transporter TAXI family solute receptor
MKHHRAATMVATAAALMLAASSVNAQIVGIATNPQGTVGYSTGVAVATVVTEKGGVVARVQPAGGSTAYIPLINRGEIEFGFSNALETHYAFTGSGTFDKKPNPDIRLVGVVYPLRTGLATAADSGVKTVYDLKKLRGKRIASEFTTLSIIHNYIAGGLANGGLSYDDFTKVPVSDFSKGMSALGDGTVDITLISVGSGDSHKVNAELRSRGGFRYVDQDDSAEAMKRLQTVMPGAGIAYMQPGPQIPGVPEPTRILQLDYFLLVHKSTPDEVVYKVAKAIAENKNDLAGSLNAFQQFDPKKMAPGHVVPYHPGALRYYKEAGIPAK